MNRVERQKIIKDVIQKNEVETQEELMLLLQKEGIHVAQATISRDIHHLKLTKSIGNNGKMNYIVFESEDETAEEKLARVLNEIALEIVQVEFLILIETIPTNAHLLAALFDKVQFFQIKATLSGHDTVLLVLGNTQEAEEIKKTLLRLKG